MNLSAAALAQRVSLNKSNVHLSEIFKDIKAQTGYNFIYKSDLLNNSKAVTISVKDADLQIVLSQLFAHQPYLYELDSKTIIVKEKKPLSFIDRIIRTFELITVYGRVIDENGAVLIGASIRVKGTDISAISDKTGSFMIKGVDEQATIIVSYKGYLTKEVRAEVIIGDIRLSPFTEDLQEVMINKGYYSESKRLTTGNVGKVSAEEISKQPVSNLLATVQGRIPGVVVTQRTGAPGGAFDIQIRGRNSISSGNQPFYVVDGVPFTSQSLSITPSTQVSIGGNPLNSLNPSDIESIEILKDADALAIYGSRGANGVVLITTKKARAGRASVDLNVYHGTGRVGHFMDLLSTAQYLEMRNEAFKNDGLTPSANRNAKAPEVFAPDLKLWDTSRYTDWQKELIGGTSKYTDAQASVSGGSVTTRFLISAGLHRETTVFPTDNAAKRISLNFNVNHTSIDQKLKLIFSGNYSDDRNNLPRTDLTQSALTLSPNAPALYKSDGTVNWENSTWRNPLVNLLQTYESHTTNLVGNLNASYEILSGLRLKAMLGYTTMKMDELNLMPFKSYDPAALPAATQSAFANNSVATWIAEPQAEYNLKIGESKITALAGATFQQNLGQGTAFTANGYTTDALLRDIRSATGILVVSAPYSLYRYNGFFGRINYNLKDKYILNVTGRRDGSSRFGPGKQFADFLAIGAAWVFTEEKLLKDIAPFLSFGKLRASYGSSGSDNIANYGFMDLWTPTNNPYLGVKGPKADKLYNPDYQWESNRKIEFGLNLGFLRDRINVAYSYYRNRSGNQLVGQVLPGMTGFASVSVNRDATVDNYGSEYELTGSVFKGKIFQWNTAINVTVAKNKLVAYPDLDKSTDVQRFVIGSPLNIARLAPVFVDQETGLYKFRNAEGAVIPLPTDYKDFTTTLVLAPEFYGGFQNQFSYKNLSLDFLFQFVKQKANNGISFMNLDPGTANNQPIEVMDRWQQAGDDKQVAKFTQKSELSSTYRSLVGDLSSDASFIRLKNVSLSYNLPGSISRKLAMQRSRIYLQGQNLFTITKFKGLDPETLSNTNLPVLSVLTVGLQLTF